MAVDLAAALLPAVAPMPPALMTVVTAAPALMAVVTAAPAVPAAAGRRPGPRRGVFSAAATPSAA